MADVLQFTPSEEISPLTIRELQGLNLLDRLSQGTIESLGLQKYAADAFPLHSFSEEPHYYVGSIVAQIGADNPVQGSLFSNEIPLESLVLENIGGVRLEEAKVRERLEYLKKAGRIVMLPNQKVSVWSIDVVLTDLIASTFGNPQVYEETSTAKVTPIGEYRREEEEETETDEFERDYEKDDNDTDAEHEQPRTEQIALEQEVEIHDRVIILRKVTLRTRDFGTPSRSLERAIKKLEQDIPDKSLYKRKKAVINYKIGAESSAQTQKYQKYGVNLVNEFEHELAAMSPEELEEFEKELNEGTKTSKQILAEAPNQLTASQTVAVMNELKYAIDPGFPNYGMQKLFGEFMVRGAQQEFGLNYLIVRPFNAVGSGELPTVTGEGQVEFGMAHVIPDFVYKAIIKQTPFEIFGDGEQVRTFTHARDIAEAVRIMLDNRSRNDDFNVCGQNTYKMGDLARQVWARVNPEIDFPGFEHLAAPAADVRFRIGKSEKARRILGWEPKYNLDFILEDTLNYIKQWVGQMK